MIFGWFSIRPDPEVKNETDPQNWEKKYKIKLIFKVGLSLYCLLQFKNNPTELE